jgi:DNA-binding transcriptional LysR family regulator
MAGLRAISGHVEQTSPFKERGQRDEDWLLLDEGHVNTPIQDVCNEARVGIDRHSFRATSLETLRHMVAHNSRVTLIPDLARRKNDGVTYVHLKSSSRYKRPSALCGEGTDCMRTRSAK